MLAEGAVPYPLVEGAPERFRLVNSRLPAQKMIALDKRFAAAQARPLIPPDRITLDNGAAYKGTVLDDVATALGISITWCNPHAPHEKGIIERFFGTVNTNFSAYFWSYLGVSADHRGEITAAQLSLGIDVVRELFAEWVLMIYHNRPHDSLCDPMTPKRKLSPNQVYAASLAYAPRFAIPITSRMLYRAYPVKWQKVTDDGVQIALHVYDSTDLDDLRNKPSGVLSHDDRWEIRYNPHNRACVWLCNPADGQFLTLPCVRYPEADKPCAEMRWQTDIEADADLSEQTEQLHARSAAESRLLKRKRSARRDRKRLHDNTHLPMPSTEPLAGPADADEPAEAANDELHERASDRGSPSGYTKTNRSPWRV